MLDEVFTASGLCLQRPCSWGWGSGSVDKVLTLQEWGPEL